MPSPVQGRVVLVHRDVQGREGYVDDYKGAHGVMFYRERNPTGGLLSLRTEGVEAGWVEARRGKLVNGVRHARK